MNKLAKRAAVGLSIVALGGAAAAFGNEVGSAIGSIGDPSPSDATPALANELAHGMDYSGYSSSHLKLDPNGKYFNLSLSFRNRSGIDCEGEYSASESSFLGFFNRHETIRLGGWLCVAAGSSLPDPNNSAEVSKA